MPTFSSEKYFYYTAGDKNHQPLVLLPGFTGTHEDLQVFAKEFSEKYFVVIPDFPGWGASPVGEYPTTIAGYAQFVVDLLSNLHSDKKILLLGHCMGSLVAIELASQNKAKIAKVFLVGVPFLEGQVSNQVFHVLSHLASHTPKIFRPLLYFFRSRLFAIPLGFFVIQTKSLRKKLSLIFKNSIKQQFQKEAVVESNWDSMVLFDFTKIKKITVPIHIFHGAKDILVSSLQAEKLQQLNREATVDVLSTAGHMPPIETPQTLATAMKKYL